MDYGTEKSGGGMTIYRSLCEDIQFWVVKRVMDGVKEEDMTNILIEFSEWTLLTVRSEIWVDVETRV